MRRAARIDAIQPAVVDALRKIGASVTPLHTLGQGVADLLVGFRQRWYVIEVKDADHGRLTEDQEKWIGSQRAPVFIVTSPAEAVGFLKLHRGY